MESVVLHSGSTNQTSSRKFSSSSSQKDLWSVCKQGSLTEVDSALFLAKKNGGSIDARNTFGLTPLHIATWRNHVPILKRLLSAGADPNARDGESGWSSLHRALHFGHLAIASVLLQTGASLTLEDSKGRTPVDLLSGPVSLVVGNAFDAVTTEVLSWGSGTNYQLGTGNAHIQKLPCKVDALQDSYITKIAASKFHSVAVGSDGKLYTWGFGRGGRLGHPDFDVHSGQAAVITPRQVISLGSHLVRYVAAAKHHTVIATENGEVFTWGSNREGQLGYTSVDTQPTPRRVSSLKVKIVAVAAASKHSAAVSEHGEVFTWGCNKEGQLGYGTSNSASNYVPRIVEYLKGKVFKAVSAAKHHTVVLRADGEVFTWGHRLVTPRRVVISRNTRKSGNAPLKFHRMERLHVISVAAGMVHSIALSDDGALFYWVSSDPDIRCRQLYSLCGRNIISISAGKYWAAAVTTTGDVYMWDGKKCKDETPVPTRLHGVKRASLVCVGETHLLALCSLYHPSYLPKSKMSAPRPLEANGEVDQIDDPTFSDIEFDRSPRSSQSDDFSNKKVPSLKSICEKVAAEFIVEPKNAIQLLEIADSLEADDLRKYCVEIALRNLDYIFTTSATAIASASTQVLAKLEKLLDTRSSEPWSYRRLPTPSATFPAIIHSDEEDNENRYLRLREKGKDAFTKHEGARVDFLFETDGVTDPAVYKQVRILKKKLQQIEILEAKQLKGHYLDNQQIAKLKTRSSLECALAELGFPLETESKQLSSSSSDAKGNKKPEVSRKQRRNNKQKAINQPEVESVNSEVSEEKHSVKDISVIEALETSPKMEDPTVDVDAIHDGTPVEDSSLQNHKEISSSFSNKKSQSKTTKKNNRKGGLSMFLRGALDDAPKHVPAPAPIPKNEGPAWGGAKFIPGHTSLRDIQNEQRKLSEMTPISTKGTLENQMETANTAKVPLSSFLPNITRPISIVQGMPAPEGEKSTPPWSSSATSPGINHRPSLRDIQMQQEKRHLSISHSPKTKVSGFSVSSTSSPTEAGGQKDSIPNRWFKPEIDAPSSIRSIQIEEKAMKDLRRFYSSVKIVKPQHQPL
ncbi:uncharacterized protein LOC122018936 [Zingiber officinale]|nr:uncharacterized protein LOC122018936 [Zingiber officinale]XP_042432346.1 uncharacterized protein LOC122018936 [Zingiber officinale]XP_042432348.1 uncharacterized protein LOC122018936 [Zingiber officinale]